MKCFRGCRDSFKRAGDSLTARDCGLEERAPMCGVPYHAAHTYLADSSQRDTRLPYANRWRTRTGKGTCQRDVTRVVTPGTIIDPTMLEDKKNNYLMCIYCRQTYFGIAVVDITTGEFFTTQITWGSSMRKLLDETARFKPSEIIANEELIKKPEYKSFLRITWESGLRY